MNAERTLTATFADHEHLAPDPDETWVGIEARLDAPRRRRVVAMVGAAAAVVAIAAGGTVVLRHEAAPPPPAAPPQPSATTARPAELRGPTSPVGATWLPPGSVPVSVSIAGGDVLLEYEAGDLEFALILGTSLKRPSGGTRITVQGHPGVAVTGANGMFAVEFEVPGRGIVAVRTPPRGRATPRHEQAARRIADSVVFDRTPVPASFVPTYVPSGLRLHGYSYLAETGTSGYGYVRGPDSLPDDDLRIFSFAGTFATSPEGRKKWPGAVPGPPVGGHETYSAPGMVWIESALPGRSIVLIGEDIPSGELYRVAEGIRVP